MKYLAICCLCLSICCVCMLLAKRQPQIQYIPYYTPIDYQFNSFEPKVPIVENTPNDEPPKTEPKSQPKTYSYDYISQSEPTKPKPKSDILDDFEQRREIDHQMRDYEEMLRKRDPKDPIPPPPPPRSGEQHDYYLKKYNEIMKKQK